MTTFLQLHLLTSYPPSNLNRDDLGRPKTAVMGGAPRLRVSSQSLKRAWRTSDLFAKAVGGDHLGTRTKRAGSDWVEQPLVEAGVDADTARAAGEAVAKVFAKLETGKSESAVHTGQLVHFSPTEREAISALVETLAAEKREPTEDELAALRAHRHRAVDISLFGRMLAEAADYNVEAAAQVAHAITVHRVAIEDDYFSAVDDLNVGAEESGAGHIGEMEFGAGLYYLYLCVDRDLLVRNLSGDEELARRALAGLTEAAAKIAPRGKQASFASRAYASYVLAEKGRQQPRSLSVAFLQPIDKVAEDGDYLAAAIEQLTETRDKLAASYGESWDDECSMDATRGEGTLSDLLEFVGSPLPVGD